MTTSPTSPAPITTRTDLVVIGGGLAGLVIARDCARAGLALTLLEADATLGGVVRPVELDDMVLDRGAEAFATRGSAVPELLDELELTERENPAQAGSWLQLPDRAIPSPASGIMGIPAEPLAADVVAALGTVGATRAWADQWLPLREADFEVGLGELVRRRMGPLVVDRLVAPIAGGVYSADVDDLDPDLVVPGLRAAMRRTGSLARAVAGMRAQRRAGAAVQVPSGGLHTLVGALAYGARASGAQLRTDAPVLGLERIDSGWQVRLADELLLADRVVVATEQHGAERLLGDLDDFADLPRSPAPGSIELITLVFDAGVVAGAPRGTGMLVARDADQVQAKAMTHASAKWAWVQDAAQGRAVLRLSYGRAGQVPATAALDETSAVALAQRDAAILLGQPLPAPRASLRVSLAQSQPSVGSGAAELRRSWRTRAAGVAGLELAGAWVAGTGLAQVIPDARAVAGRLLASARAGGDASPTTATDPAAMNTK